MYRGIARLNNKGEAVVDLPEYFSQINKNFSYQLTAIGTSHTPYILTEIENNQFKIAGKANTQVSWVVIANRNDLYFQKYPEKAKDVVEKPDQMKGTYYMPELYNMPASKGTFTNYEPPKKEITLHPDEIVVPTQLHIKE